MVSEDIDRRLHQLEARMATMETAFGQHDKHCQEFRHDTRKAIVEAKDAITRTNDALAKTNVTLASVEASLRGVRRSLGKYSGGLAVFVFILFSLLGILVGISVKNSSHTSRIIERIEEATSKSGARWTDEELDILRSSFLAGDNTDDIAAALRRTPPSVRAQIQRQGWAREPAAEQ